MDSVSYSNLSNIVEIRGIYSKNSFLEHKKTVAEKNADFIIINSRLICKETIESLYDIHYYIEEMGIHGITLSTFIVTPKK